MDARRLLVSPDAISCNDPTDQIKKKGAAVLMRDVSKERAAIEAAIGDVTLVDVLNRNAQRFASLPAINWSDDAGHHTISWVAYREKVREVAAGLMSLGVDKGDFVAIMSGNRPEHVISDLGNRLAGGVPVSLYNTLATPQISTWPIIAKPGRHRRKTSST